VLSKLRLHLPTVATFNGNVTAVDEKELSTVSKNRGRECAVEENVSRNTRVLSLSTRSGPAYVAQSLCNCRASVRPSVCLSHSPAARRCCAFAAVGPAGKRKRPIAAAAGLSAGRRAKAGSATLSAYVEAEHSLVAGCTDHSQRLRFVLTISGAT